MRRWSLLLLLAAGSSCSAQPPPAPAPPAPSEPAEPAAPPATAEPPATAAMEAKDPLQGPPAGEPAETGPLTPKAIQRIIRANFGRFRLCYEQSLRTSPNLQDRAVVQFVIGKDGTVASARPVLKDTTLWSQETIRCIVDAMKTLRFPRPAQGTITVVYPIMFAPGD